MMKMKVSASFVILGLEMKEIDPEQNSQYPRMSHQLEPDSGSEEDVSDVDEIVEDEGFDEMGEGEDVFAQEEKGEERFIGVFWIREGSERGLEGF